MAKRDRSTVGYEWCAEVMDGEDVQEVLFSTSLAQAREQGEAMRPQPFRLVLVRDRFKDGDLADRQYAYLDEAGRLPTHFDGGAAVQERYRAEASAAGRA